MSPYLIDDATISAMAAELRRYHFFDQIFARPGAARIALIQAGFPASEAGRLGEVAVIYERARREAFPVSRAEKRPLPNPPPHSPSGRTGVLPDALWRERERAPCQRPETTPSPAPKARGRDGEGAVKAGHAA